MFSRARWRRGLPALSLEGKKEELPVKPVKIYTTTYCGYCVRAKDLHTRMGVDY